MTWSKSSENGYMTLCGLLCCLFGAIFLVPTLMYLPRGKWRKDMYIMVNG
jgi:hypothetical protein